MYCSRGESVRFVYVTNLRVEGKQTHILCETKTLSTQEMRQWATRYCRWEIISRIWVVYASLSASPPTSLISLPFTSNGSRSHRFAPTAVLNVLLGELYTQETISTCL
jgi:hypothetical protein